MSKAKHVEKRKKLYKKYFGNMMLEFYYLGIYAYENIEYFVSLRLNHTFLDIIQ